MTEYQPAIEAGERPAAVRVAIVVQGGNVQAVVTDHPGLAVSVVDYDVDGSEPERVRAIPQDNGLTAPGHVAALTANHDPAWLDAVASAPVNCPDMARASESKPATYSYHHSALTAAGFERGARDERTTYRHPDGRTVKLKVAEEGDGALFVAVTL